MKRHSTVSFLYSRTFLYTSGGILAVLLLLAFISAPAQPLRTKTASLIASEKSVLGDDDSGQEDEKEAEDADEAEKNEDEKNEDDEKDEDEADEKKIETAREVKQESKGSSAPSGAAKMTTKSVDAVGTKTTTQKEGKKSESETETKDGQKIKTKVEDNGTTKIEVERKNIKIKYEMRNGQITTKAEDEKGEEVEMEDEELEKLEDEIEDDSDEDSIKIATGGAGQLKFTKNHFAASTKFPLSVDVDTNELIVTTPKGEKAVTVLPEQVIQNLYAKNIVNRIEEAEEEDEASEKDESSVNRHMILTEKDGTPVYELTGVSDKKFLGVLSVKVEKEIVVSAETGNVLSTDISFGDRILDLLSL